MLSHFPREQWRLLVYLAYWSAVALPMAAAIGSAVALFLWLLDAATRARWDHPWLIWFLPVGGVLIVAAYRRLGAESEGGSNLIIQTINGSRGRVPRRMGPLVLVCTVITHLFGGSAGREGTAVQIGGAFAQAVAHWFRVHGANLRILLMAGVAAGFGAVFGTPLAGAIFAMEVATRGQIRYEALIPCIMAAVAGDVVCTWWGTYHTHYSIASGAAPHGPVLAALEPILLAKTAIAGVAFGLAALLFSQTSHLLVRLFRKVAKPWWLPPVIGSAILIGMTIALDGRNFLGLGVSTPDGVGVCIASAFGEGTCKPFDWLWKLVFTAVTISSGFKGGEVTPLFFIGATLGHTIAVQMGVPVDFLAGVGFVAVLAGATNTPLACTIMAVELFGAEYLLYFATACFMAYIASGNTGIYVAQTAASPKFHPNRPHSDRLSCSTISQEESNSPIHHG